MGKRAGAYIGTNVFRSKTEDERKKESAICGFG